MNKLLVATVCIVSFLSSNASFAELRPKVEFKNSGAVLEKSSTLPFSESVRVGDTIYLSGQIGSVPGTLSLVEGGIKEETRQTMNNIKAVLEADGLSMKNIVKCTVMLADMSEWSSFNDVYVSFFAGPYPARSAFGASGLALGARTEVECLAVDY